MPTTKVGLLTFLCVALFILVVGVFKWIPESYEKKHQYEHHMTAEEREFEQDRWEDEAEYADENPRTL